MCPWLTKVSSMHKAEWVQFVVAAMDKASSNMGFPGLLDHISHIALCSELTWRSCLEQIPSIPTQRIYFGWMTEWCQVRTNSLVTRPLQYAYKAHNASIIDRRKQSKLAKTNSSRIARSLFQHLAKDG